MNRNYLIVATIVLGLITLSVVKNKGKFKNLFQNNSQENSSQPDHWESWTPQVHGQFAKPNDNDDDKPEIVYAKSYDEALELSKTSNRQIFLYFEADWCGWCVKMKRDTLSQAQVKKALEAKYIVYHVNVDKEKSISTKYGVRSMPTYMIVDANEKVIKKTNGYKDVKKFISWLEN